MKKLEAKKSLWREHFRKHKEKFSALVSFLETNHARVDNYHLTSIHSEFVIRKSAKEKIYFAFLGCLNAAGGNNLTATGEACRKMRDVLQELPDSPEIKFATFTTRLDSPKQISSSKELFSYLSNADRHPNDKKTAFKNMGYKKAALFMKSIYYAQRQNDIRFFSDLAPHEVHRPLPLDIVIGEIISMTLHLPYENRIGSGDAKEFEEFAREILDKEYYILEDLWYWGYFGTWVRKENYRIVKYNPVKYMTDRTFFPMEDGALEEKIDQFSRIVNPAKSFP
jgi:hypothetical protein